MSFIKRAQEAAAQAAEAARVTATAANQKANDPATQEAMARSARDAMGVARRGVTTVVEKIDPGNTGGTLYHKDFDLTFVPAWHSASHLVDGRPIHLGACCGLVIATRRARPFTIWATRRSFPTWP